MIATSRAHASTAGLPSAPPTTAAGAAPAAPFTWTPGRIAQVAAGTAGGSVAGGVGGGILFALLGAQLGGDIESRVKVGGILGAAAGAAVGGFLVSSGL